VEGLFSRLIHEGDESVPAITKKKAVEALTAEAGRAHADDLVEIHNELFPETPTTEQAANEDLEGLRTKVLDHMKSLEIEEILGLWSVVFPQDREVWYDEEKKKFNYQRGKAAVQAD
jgi:hypothetical protein